MLCSAILGFVHLILVRVSPNNGERSSMVRPGTNKTSTIDRIPITARNTRKDPLSASKQIPREERLKSNLSHVCNPFHTEEPIPGEEKTGNSRGNLTPLPDPCSFHTSCIFPWNDELKSHSSIIMSLEISLKKCKVIHFVW